VDHFKSYNDRFGHPAGDACLRGIAQAILGLQHRSTDLLARYGGEEFAYLLPCASLVDAMRIGEMIRARIGTMHQDAEDGNAVPVTISIGCAAMTPGPGHVSEVERLVGAADEALYRAKRNGRNRVEAMGNPSMPPDLGSANAEQN